MAVQLPTPEQLLIIADEMGLSLTEKDVDSFIGILRPSIAAYNVIDAMADKLNAKPHLGTVLERVRQDSESVFLEFDTHEVEVDRVILTMPPPALEKIIFGPTVRAYQHVVYEANMHVVRQKLCEACRLGLELIPVHLFSCDLQNGAGALFCRFHG